MEPSFDGGDNSVGAGFPDEGLGVLIVILDEAVTGVLDIDEGVEAAVFKPPLRELGEDAFDGVNHEHDVGVSVEGPAGMPD